MRPDDDLLKLSHEAGKSVAPDVSELLREIRAAKRKDANENCTTHYHRALERARQAEAEVERLRAKLTEAATDYEDDVWQLCNERDALAYILDQAEQPHSVECWNQMTPYKPVCVCGVFEALGNAAYHAERVCLERAVIEAVRKKIAHDEDADEPCLTCETYVEEALAALDAHERKEQADG